MELPSRDHPVVWYFEMTHRFFGKFVYSRRKMSRCVTKLLNVPSVLECMSVRFHGD
jgi:hypothetical protein